MLKRVTKLLGKRAVLAVYALMRILPLRKQLIFFESNLGRNCAGNVKEIYRELAQKKHDGTSYRCVWSFDSLPLRYSTGDIEKMYDMPSISEAGSVSELIIVRRRSVRYFFFLACARLWVSNCRMPAYLKKRSKQVYIQTWHGTPLKKLALDMTHSCMAGEEDIEAYHEGFRRNSRTWDYLLSQNAYSTKIFRRCFDYHGVILQTGYPRNDVLVACRNNAARAEEEKNRLRDKLGLPRDGKVIVYAPTWRDDEANGKNTYSFSTALDYEELLRLLGNEYTILVKSHYLVKDSLDLFRYRGAVRSFDEKCDIADLYLVSDVLVTDYSSVMFDYSLLGRPMIFYCYDLERYKDDIRGFYFDFESVAPGPVVSTTEELARAICDYDPGEWEERYAAFSKRFDSFESGCASNLMGELINEICSGAKRKTEEKCKAGIV